MKKRTRFLVGLGLGLILFFFTASVGASIPSVNSGAGEAGKLPAAPTSRNDCVPSYLLVKLPALALERLKQQAQGVVVLGSFGDVTVTLVCQSELRDLTNVSPTAIAARQTRSLVLPHFDPATGQWQQVRYVWYEENQAGYLLEHVTVLDLQTGSVLATTVVMVEAGDRVGESLTISRIDLITNEATIDQVTTPQNALKVLLDRWRIPGVTARVALRFLVNRPVWHIERSEEEGAVVYLVDGITGAPLGRYPTLSREAHPSSNSEVTRHSQMDLPVSTSAPSQSSLDSSGSVFVVGVDNFASWRDLSALAVVPAAARANNGKPVVLLRSLQHNQDPSLSQFIALYNPSQIYYVGTWDPGAITGANEIQLAANLADVFWTQSPTATLAVNTDYTGTLLAAQLAARLDSPLLFVTPTEVPVETQDRLATLGTTSAILVGSPGDEVLAQLQALGIGTTVLDDAKAVAAYTAAIGAVNYVVVTNPMDRSYAGWVPRLSLLAPALAAYHHGILYPASYDVEWKVTHTATVTTTTRPAGAWQGSDDFICYEFAADAPPRAPGATWQVCPLQGHYARGTMDWLAGDEWERREFYLAASSPGVVSFDRALIDVNADGLFSNNEVFTAGQTFTVNARLYRVYEMDGDGDWGGRLDHVVLRFETWKLGTARVGGVSYPFVVTCGKASDTFGAYDVANIDLNYDSDFGDEGEGPFWPGDSVVLGGIRYAVTPGHDGSLRLTYPDAREIAADMWQQLSALSLNPDYVAIVGYYDAVPFGVYRDIMISYEDVSSDMAFGDHDADPFLDASVGRLFGSDVFKASALIARSITYADIAGSWRQQGLTLSNWSLDFCGAETTAKNIERQLENVGVSVTGLYEADYANNWDVSLLADKAFVAHFDHGTPMDPWNMRTVAIDPAVGTFWGCSSAWIEQDPYSVNATAFLDQGGAGYMGNTRLGAAPVSEHAFSLFWNRVINDRLPFGQTHRASVNFKVLDWLESQHFGDLSLGYRLVYYGDPAILPILPGSPAVAPAHTTATGSEAGETVAYNGPQVWWTDTAHDDYGTTYYAVTGPGIAPTGWFATRYVVEQPASEPVQRVVQNTQVSWPLGWTGHYFFDEGPDRQVVWMLTPMDYDETDGEIQDEAPYLEYTLLSTPLLNEIGQEAGVSEGDSHAVTWGDYDEDGDLDLFVTAVNGVNRLYRNEEGSMFTEVGAVAGVARSGTSRGAVFADMDNDGDLDLYVANEGDAAVFYRNNDDGTFSDVTSMARLAGAHGGMAPLVADYDRDGYLDLYVTVWGCDILYRNNGDGTFGNATAAAGVSNCHASVGGAWADYDGDGDQDIYIANFWSAPNVLYRNNGDGTFTEVAALAGMDDANNGEGVAWGDYDNDGNLDLYLANDGNQANVLYRNNGDGTFTDVTVEAGVGDTGTGRNPLFADIDNDGDLDLYMVNAGQANVLYRNNGDGTFTDVAWMWGGDDASGGQGAATGDYDNDGYLDLYVVNLGAPNLLYHNNGGDNRWLVVRAVGTISNRDGIGARVTITSDGHMQMREVRAGTGWLCQDSLPVEFGLGAYAGVATVTIHWPSGDVQTLTNVATNRVVTVTEPTPTPVGGASFDYDPSEPWAGEGITFSGTVAVGSEPITYDWAFGDGNGDTGQIVLHTYAIGNDYTVIMTGTNAYGSDTFSQIIRATLHYDLDRDCDVDIADIMAVASRWRCKCGDACYDPLYDLDGDCDIDIVDIMTVASRWGWACGQPDPVQLMGLHDVPPIAMWTNPGMSMVAPDDTFSMAIEVEGAADLGGFQLALNFDPVVVRVEGVTLGDFLGSTGRNTVPLGPEVDNDAGTITFGGFSFGSQPGASGDGVLAILTLTAQGAGNSPLHLENVQVADTGGQAQTVTVEDGMVTVGVPQRIYLPLIVKGNSN